MVIQNTVKHSKKSVPIKKKRGTAPSKNLPHFSTSPQFRATPPNMLQYHHEQSTYHPPRTPTRPELLNLLGIQHPHPSPRSDDLRQYAFPQSALRFDSLRHNPHPDPYTQHDPRPGTHPLPHHDRRSTQDPHPPASPPHLQKPHRQHHHTNPKDDQCLPNSTWNSLRISSTISPHCDARTSNLPNSTPWHCLCRLTVGRIPTSKPTPESEPQPSVPTEKSAWETTNYPSSPIHIPTHRTSTHYTPSTQPPPIRPVSPTSQRSPPPKSRNSKPSINPTEHNPISTISNPSSTNRNGARCPTSHPNSWYTIH